MKLTLSHTIAALFLVLGIFFLAATPAHAAAVTLPLQLSYDGLTFVGSLTYTNDAPVKKATLTFTIPETLAITHEKTKEVIGEVVVLPTVTSAVTLPLLPSQPPPSAFQTEEEAQEIAISKVPAPSVKNLIGKTPSPTPKLITSKVSSTQDVIDPTPTTAPTSTPVSIAPAATNTSTGGGLDAETLFNMSNAYRQAQGLAPFQKDERACTLAASRAPEIAGEIAGGHMHSGLRARNLPYWNSENIISMRSEEAAFNWWINDKIHHDAIVGNYTYSCVACSGNSCAPRIHQLPAEITHTTISLH